MEASLDIKFRLLFIAICFSQLLSIATAKTGSPCLTPSNQTGVCVSNDDCPIFIEARDKYLSENVEYFRRLQCDYDENSPSICCLSEGDYDVIRLDIPSQKKVRENDTKINVADRFETGKLFPGKDVCGIQVYSDKIFNGEIVDIDEFPWMVLLFYKTKINSNKSGCGGVLINDRYVLTAAHCVSEIVNKTFGGLDFVRLGEYNLETNEDCVITGNFADCSNPVVDIEPEEIIVFPHFDAYSLDQHHDIALIRLKDKVVYSDFIRPICLPDYEEFPNFNLTYDDNRLYVAGWGKTERGFSSSVKLKLKLPIFNHDKCIETYGKFNITITPCQLCAGGEINKDSCKGDSGGPLMGADPITGNWLACGIVSIGPNMCGVGGVPGVYTSVKEYMCWIKEVVRP